MNKKILALAMAMAFTVGTVAISFANVKCEVKSVSGSTVTLDCGGDAGKLEVGSTVKVKAGKKKGGAAIEGC